MFTKNYRNRQKKAVQFSIGWFAILQLLILLSACQRDPGPIPIAPTNVPAGEQSIITIGDDAIEDSGLFLPLLYEVSDLTAQVEPGVPPQFVGSLPQPLTTNNDERQRSGQVTLQIGKSNLVGQWVYAAVAPFPSPIKTLSSIDLSALWLDESGPNLGPLVMDPDTYATFTAFLGPAAPDAVVLLQPEDIPGYAWTFPPSVAIIPFEQLAPLWKVLPIDGHSPIAPDFNAASYPLTIPISISGDPVFIDLFKETFLTDQTLHSNRRADRLTTLALTGVTAMARATAYTMEIQGVTYPAQDIAPWLLEADITHVSNEVPFAPNCPFPNPVQAAAVFCSSDRYIELLEAIGTDIVELSGDHFQDWGREAMIHTLDLYTANNIPYYGGGINATDASRPLLIEHNGNRLAFIGCNAKGGPYAQASESSPGAVLCDFEAIEIQIHGLVEQGYLPIVTFQHQEHYTYAPHPAQQRDFRRVAEAGAVIVSGSQAHQPQGMEFYGAEKRFIHYGLGNLFFDQYDYCFACRQGTVDRHIFYNGRHIQTELLPYIFIDYARPRPMTPAESDQLFNALFTASGW
ncbi:MAG: CapA family protein [Chloroflexota bacterium]